MRTLPLALAITCFAHGHCEGFYNASYATLRFSSPPRTLLSDCLRPCKCANSAITTSLSRASWRWLPRSPKCIMRLSIKCPTLPHPGHVHGREFDRFLNKNLAPGVGNLNSYNAHEQDFTWRIARCVRRCVLSSHINYATLMTTPTYAGKGYCPYAYDLKSPWRLF